MELKLKDAAKLLNVSEKTIYRWIADNKIPFYKINSQFRFKREELEQWAKGKNDDVGSPQNIPTTHINAVDLISRGGIHYRVEGSIPFDIIKNCMKIIPLPGGIDREKTTKLLIEREEMMPTGIGKGVAVPHPRHPKLNSVESEFASICFLEKSVDFGSLDGELIHTVIILVCANTARHLRAISEISFLCLKTSVFDLLMKRALREEIMTALKTERQNLYKRLS